jgi:hypothetical protein
MGNLRDRIVQSLKASRGFAQDNAASILTGLGTGAATYALTGLGKNKGKNRLLRALLSGVTGFGAGYGVHRAGKAFESAKAYFKAYLEQQRLGRMSNARQTQAPAEEYRRGEAEEALQKANAKRLMEVGRHWQDLEDDKNEAARFNAKAQSQAAAEAMRTKAGISEALNEEALSHAAARRATWQDLEDDKNEAARFNAKAQSQAAAEAIGGHRRYREDDVNELMGEELSSRTKAGISEALNEEALRNAAARRATRMQQHVRDNYGSRRSEILDGYKRYHRAQALNQRNAAARRATRMQQHVRDNYGSRRSEILDGYKRYHRAQALNQRNIDENILMGSSKAGLRAEADRLADWQDRSPRVYDMRTPPYGGNTLVDTYPMSQQSSNKGNVSVKPAKQTRNNVAAKNSITNAIVNQPGYPQDDNAAIINAIVNQYKYSPQTQAATADAFAMSSDPAQRYTTETLAQANKGQSSTGTGNAVDPANLAYSDIIAQIEGADKMQREQYKNENEEELRNAAARRATRMQQHVRDNYGSRRSEILDGYKRYHRAQALNQRNIDENILMGSSKAGLRAEADRLADWQDRSPRVYDMRTPPYGGNTLADTYLMSQQAPTAAEAMRTKAGISEALNEEALRHAAARRATRMQQHVRDNYGSRRSQQDPIRAFMSRPIIDSLRQFGRWLNTPAIDASNAVNRVNRLRSRIPTSIGHNYIRRADVR